MFSKQKALSELSELLSFDTISNNSKQKAAMYNCAKWLERHFKSIGMQYAITYETSVHPVVYAEYIVNPSYKTILFYGHYDVQPVDPISKWNSPPFKAVIKGNYIYGRGASDDKGQFFIHVKAVEKIINEKKQPPINIKFLIEGAEEIGSVGLKEFIAQHKNMLHCDAVVVSDTKMISLNEPAITYSLRGSLNAEVFIQTSRKDLHSGTFGGYVPDAALSLGKFINRLYNQDDSISIPGFYSDVKPISNHERKFIKANASNNDKLLNEAQTFSVWGEKNYSLHERSTIRPSVAITGVTAGFQGKGTKNVIPATASIKFNFRLVPNQHPQKIKMLFDEYVKRNIPGAVVKTIYSSFNEPLTVSRKNPYIKAAVDAYENVFATQVKFIQNGGTIGAADYLHSILKVPVVFMGFAQASDNMHAPNEKFYLPNFFRGIETIKKFIQNISLLNAKKNLHATLYY